MSWLYYSAKNSAAECEEFALTSEIKCKASVTSWLLSSMIWQHLRLCVF